MIMIYIPHGFSKVIKRSAASILLTSCFFGPALAGNFFKPVISLHPETQRFIIRSYTNDKNKRSFAVNPIFTESGRATTVSVRLPGPINKIYAQANGPAFLMFRDVPSEITFSAGFRLTNSWAISLNDVSNIQMRTAPGYSAVLSLPVLLYIGKERAPLTASALIRILNQIDKVEKNNTEDLLDFKTPNTTYKRLSLNEIYEEFNRAKQLMDAGDVHSARLIYTELADQGNIEAIYLLGNTYDPDILLNSFIIGLTPDINQAIEWYKKAAELGEKRAIARLDAFRKKGEAASK